jgi:hypothetical protein
MPDHNDMPEPGRDPMDDAYLRAEQALNDEAERAARRDRVLAAVAPQAAPAAPAPSARRPIRRYGGWLAAACVAGLSVWTAGQVYRSSPRRQESAPPAVQPPAPSAAKAPPPPVAAFQPPVTPRARPEPPPVTVPRRALAAAEPPPAEAPPPLPIPPVEKPILQPSPALTIPRIETPIAPPATLAAPAVAAKSALAAAGGARQEAQTVVVTGSRIDRRDYAASTPAISDVSQARMRAEAAKLGAEAARLRYDAVAGRTADIEAVLAEGTPVDAADEDGETALMKSIESGQREAAALLLRHGANLDLKNHAGVSARDMAARKNDPALNQALGISPLGAATP